MTGTPRPVTVQLISLDNSWFDLANLLRVLRAHSASSRTVYVLSFAQLAQRNYLALARGNGPSARLRLLRSWRRKAMNLGRVITQALRATGAVEIRWEEIVRSPRFRTIYRGLVKRFSESETFRTRVVSLGHGPLTTIASRRPGGMSIVGPTELQLNCASRFLLAELAAISVLPSIVGGPVVVSYPHVLPFGLQDVPGWDGEAPQLEISFAVDP